MKRRQGGVGQDDARELAGGIYLSSLQTLSAELAGEKIKKILAKTSGNGALIGGLKVVMESGWFGARPSGTEDIYKYMRRVSTVWTICTESWKKHKQWSTTRLQFEGDLRCILINPFERSSTMKTEFVKIAGMSCGGCTSKVTNALKLVSGVSDVNVSLSAGEATVHYDERLATPEQLKAVLMDAGYSVDSTDTARKPQGKGCFCN